MSVIGLGPGDPALTAPMAAGLLAEAEVVVGYHAYIDLIPKASLVGKEVVATGMTGEVARCREAVAAAAAGRRVVVVSSGDAGVYGMAGLCLELLEALGLIDTVPFAVAPGIPALVAAAALLGAPLSHDFAAVSLSDLLTPWAVIERRIEAAAAADFVLALYNPRSKRRAGHLEQAFAILRRHRPPDTPVGMVKNAYRAGQEVHVRRLAEADPGLADMLTIVIVGNDSSRLVAGRILTPRGYHGKYSLK